MIEFHPKNTMSSYIKNLKIDPENEELLRQHWWRVSSNGYVKTSINRRDVMLHRLLTNAKDGEYVDHINRDKLDNRKHNLRIVDAGENRRNSKVNSNSRSGESEVHFENGKYRARVHWKGKRLSAGSFSSREEAVRARDMLYQKLCEGTGTLNDLL